MLTKLQESDLLVVTNIPLSGDLVVTKTISTCHIEIPNFLKYYGSYKKTEAPTPPNKIKENKRKEKKTYISAQAPKSDLDFEALYAAYPRKQGKSKGLAKCKTAIKNQTTYDLVLKAITQYKALCEANETEVEYIKHFSTFMNCWEDYLPGVGEPLPSANWMRDMFKPDDFSDVDPDSKLYQIHKNLEKESHESAIN